MEYNQFRKKAFSHKPMSAFGPEHEFSIVDEQMKPLPIADKVIKAYCGKIVDFIYSKDFAFGKEFPLHQMEIKATKPFKSPQSFEETMQNAVTAVLQFLRKKYHAYLLGTGMHPLLDVEDTSIWAHSRYDLIQKLERIFNLRYQGWLNTQSFQINFPYYNQIWAIALFNALTHLSSYLPAISASSPICGGVLSPNVDTRLPFFKKRTKELPSIVGDVIPDYITSFDEYRETVIDTISRDLVNAGVDYKMINAEWMNERGIVLRFSRCAIEVRIIDEQECIKSDVALSCFIRATVRGLIAENVKLHPHKSLIKDYNSVVKYGLEAAVEHPFGRTAKEVCQHFFKIAAEQADTNERKYLWIVRRRIEEGNLSGLIRKRVLAKAKKTTFKEAVTSVYSQLAKALAENQPYF